MSKTQSTHSLVCRVRPAKAPMPGPLQCVGPLPWGSVPTSSSLSHTDTTRLRVAPNKSINPTPSPLAAVWVPCARLRFGAGYARR